MRKERHGQWKGGVSTEDQLFRTSIEYKLWRTAVYVRDDFTCQVCHERGGRLVAHHIKSFAKYPDLRIDIDNGITLCEDCHHDVHARRVQLLIGR